MRGGLFKTVRREKIRAIDLHDLDIKNGSAGLVDERSFGEDQDLCIRFTYQRLPRLSKIRTGGEDGEVNNPRKQLFGRPRDRAEELSNGNHFQGGIYGKSQTTQGSSKKH